MTRVLVIDDSAVLRQLFTTTLSRDPELQVVGAAADPFDALRMILQFEPDVITLDIEMPKMDGLTFLGNVMKRHPLPAVIVSSFTQKGNQLAAEARSCGAVSVLCKPQDGLASGDFGRALIDAVKHAAKCKVASASIAPPPPKPRPQRHSGRDRIIAIGASTGGTKALEEILTSLPTDVPGIAIVQHMPERFTKSFADRLNHECAIEVREAQDGDLVRPGQALIAPGNHHLLLRREGAQYFAQVKSGPLVSQHRPSVDLLFRSVARSAGKAAVGVILTGMGHDGARGLLEMRTAGATTIAQDEESCIVYGMPREAVAIGAAQHSVSLHDMAEAILAAAFDHPVAGRTPEKV